jgi:hypothetical protein
VTTNSNGYWVANGLPSGDVKIEASAQGFQKQVYNKRPIMPRSRRFTAFSLT